ATADAAATTTTKKAVVKAPHAPKKPVDWGHKPTDHPKLDRKLNDRAELGGSGISRVIVIKTHGTDLSADYAKVGGKKGQSLDLIDGDVVEVPNGQLRKLADSTKVKSLHHDRKTGGEMNYAAVIEGARAVQAAYGYNGRGIDL